MKSFGSGWWWTVRLLDESICITLTLNSSWGQPVQNKCLSRKLLKQHCALLCSVAISTRSISPGVWNCTFLPPGKSFDPTFLLSCTVSNVICCMVFSQRFSYDDKQFLQLLKIISEVLRFNSSFLGQVSGGGDLFKERRLIVLLIIYQMSGKRQFCKL